MALSGHDLFEAGDLAGAIDAMNAEVRTRPADVNARGFLAELLCFQGNLQRADVLLDALGKQDPAAMIGVALFRQVIRAALTRQEVFAEGRAPELLGEPPEHLRLTLQALAAWRAGQAAEATALCAQAEAARPPVAGTHNEAAFTDMRDIDDITAGVLEVLTSTGKYYWVPLEQVQVIDFKPAEQARDLLWRRAQVTVAGGPDGEVFIPTVYPWAEADADEPRAKLARITEWLGGGDDGPVRGQGQRMYLIGDDAVPVLEIGSLSFAGAS